MAADKRSLVSREAALPGRPDPIPTSERHVVLGTALKAPLTTSQEEALFGCGCFWGAEKGFWRLPRPFGRLLGARHARHRRQRLPLQRNPPAGAA